jgi:hypothetical protein
VEIGLSAWPHGFSDGTTPCHRADGQDVRLYLAESKALGLPVEVAEAVARLSEAALHDEGADSDFTSAIRPIERAAGVTVGPVARTPERRE